MLEFLKKLVGFPTASEIAAAQAPYKIEAPAIAVNNKSEKSVKPATAGAQVVEIATAAAKKPRKPRTPTAEKVTTVVKEKAAKPVKAAAIKTPAKRLKKT